ncbi:hypothetical protein V6N12_022809 [Hibiscus sabdariffa]|uniref:Uncharacterized protein n=1 Tax=Hibiscus sabdariffa TaxID=183260 RepID=A0ABR2FVS5_9ROSI
MANPPKPWKAEYAKSARSSRKSTKKGYHQGGLQARQNDVEPCRLYTKESKSDKVMCSTDDVEDIESLQWEDQQKIRNYVESGGPSNAKNVTPPAMEYAIEVSQSSRVVLLARLRISSKPEGQGSKGLVWNHAKCFLELTPTSQVEKLPGWENLPSSDQANISALVKKVPAAKKGKGTEVPEEKRSQSTSTAGAKRKKDPKDSDLETKLEDQIKELWAFKDELKKHVTTAELREMLEANGQDATGWELDLRDRCADGMMFGALGKCPMCSGCLHFSGGKYRCHGYISAWSKCSYSTCEPERLKGKWRVPDETNNDFLSKEEWKGKIKEAGGIVHAKIKNDTNCLVVSGELDGHAAEMRKARRMILPIVRDDYLVDCFKRQKKLPFDLYKVEAIGEASSMVIVKVKGQSAVHEASGLQYSGHILEDEGKDEGSGCYVFRKWGRVGNEKIGGNKLQEMSKSDAISEFKRLFFEKTGNTWEAWEQKENFQKQPGRFFPLDYGVNKQVSQKKHTDADSRLPPPLLELVKMLFNVETYRQVAHFTSKRSPLSYSFKLLRCLNDPFFDYRAAMMEFEINMSEMPLGKLSKSNIQKGS